MTTKKKNPFKKVVKKTSPQPKKEYKPEVIKPKKELISDPDSYISVCMTRSEAYRIKNKFKDDERFQDLFGRVLNMESAAC